MHKAWLVLAIQERQLVKMPGRQVAEIAEIVANRGQHVAGQRAGKVLDQQIVIVELILELGRVLKKGHITKLAYLEGFVPVFVSMPAHDLIVVSDLHMGRGKNSSTGRYHNLETFFYDDDFGQFCQYICEQASSHGRSLRLIFNGDAFDFLRIEPEAAGPSASLRERRYGPVMDASAAGRMIKDILVGHPRFVDALAQVLQFGHEVIFLPGNHDRELQWEAVQTELRTIVIDRVRARAGEAAAQESSTRLRFEAWFYHEPGRVWLEHGCQYDPENAYHYPLRGDLAGEEAFKELERDMPLGNFFQRYLYNHFGHITFLVPSTRANMRYMKFLLIHQPRLLARVIGSQVPFLFQMLRRVARGAASRKRLKEAHEAGLSRLAHQSGLGEKLVAIDELKETRADITQAARSITRQFIKLLATIGLVSLMVVGLYFVGFLAITQLQSGFGIKSLLFLSLNFLMLIATVIVFGFALFRMSPDVPAQPLRVAAQKIARLLDVPIVSFGHTHDEVIFQLPRESGEPGWYYNTGTWIAVFMHDVLLPRERVQFTYLRIRDDEASLLQWSPGRGAPMPVILLDEGDADYPAHPPGAPHG